MIFYIEMGKSQPNDFELCCWLCIFVNIYDFYLSWVTGPVPEPEFDSCSALDFFENFNNLSDYGTTSYCQ